MVQPLKTKLKCYQINLQHSPAAADNLMQIMNTGNIDIAFIQEPYVNQNGIKGITKEYRTYAYGEEKSRTAIIIPNDTIDAIMITQCSDNDIVLFEIKMGQKNSMQPEPTWSTTMQYKNHSKR